jgi:hypothetical protein
MALKFLPVQTPSTVGILVLTRDKYLQSEFELALQEYQYVFYAIDTKKAISILTEDQIGVIIIDANNLESDDRELISEMLTLFPELLLIPFVEAGSTHNLVTLSEKYDIYRYLKIPCTHKQIASCVRGAVKKYLKLYANKENTESSSLTFFLRHKYMAATAMVIVTILLIFMLTTINPDTENNDQEQTLTQNQQPGINNIINEHPDIATPTETISVIEQILLNAHNAYKAEHYYDPENKSALFFYIKALNLEPKNQEALTGLQIVLNLMVDNINTSLNNEEYYYAVKLSSILAKTLPNNPLTEPLLKHLSDQGLNLVAQAKKLADNGELDTANTTLLNAKILLGDNHVEISAAESYISSTTEQSSLLNGYLEKAQLRLNNENLTKPTDDSAIFYLISVKEMAPENDKLNSLLIELADKLLGHANAATNENNIPRAKYFLQEVKTLGVRTEIISHLEENIITQKDTAPAQRLTEPQPDTIQERIEKQEKINKLLISARKSYNTEQYFSPDNNNASHFLLLAKMIDPHNEDINYSLNELADQILLMIRTKLADKQMAEASSLINHVKQLGVRTEEIRKLEQEVN